MTGKADACATELGDVSEHPDESGQRPRTLEEFVKSQTSPTSSVERSSVEEPTPKTVDDMIALAAQAEEEAAEAEALAVAARARARAIQLRRRAGFVNAPPDVDQATQVDDEADPVGAKSGVETSTSVASREPTRPRRYRRLLRLPSRSAIGVGLSIMVIVGALTGSGYIVWNHQEVSQERELAAEFTAAARKGVVELTSLDFNKAKEDAQRIIDNSAGEFRSDFESKSGDFIKVVQDSKVITKGTVRGTAVESMSADSAVVLVAAISEVTNAAGGKHEPRSWRLSVTVTRDNGQIKLSKVEFVP